jgi:type I site-specific restriction endonuclease
MEPVIVEMNVPIAIACVIGMIGIVSWGVVKNFENKMRVNPTMAGDGLVGIESGGDDVEEEETEETEEEEQTVEEQQTEEAEEAEDAKELHDSNFTATAIESDEVLDTEMDEEVEKEKQQAQTIQTDIDTFHEKIEEIDNKLQVTRNLVTELCQTVIDTNNSTKSHFNKMIDALESKMTASVQEVANTASTNLSRLGKDLVVMGSAVPKDYARIEDVQNFVKECATIREFNELKTQIDELLKRSSLQKTVYQAWNGSSKWTDFNEGELNIQMIRKKFMTTEQNEDWLLPENKKIAAYNRDQLLGLSEDTWTTTDNTVFVKRYYKDDWDSSIEVAITVTLSKKILVPPGGKPETIITHILKKLYEKDQITWEHLLVNA